MKIGKSIVELATELERQREMKKDYIVPTTVMDMLYGSGKHHIGFGDMQVGVLDLAHQQVAEHTGIPKAYYEVMRTQQPHLLCQNVNTWFKAGDKVRMVRTLDGNARAFLSDRYRPMENDQLAEAVLPVLSDLKVEILSCDITDKRLYIKAVDARIKKDIPTGHKMGDGTHTIFDTVCPAIVIKNSEVGCGSLAVETSVFTKACTNLATFADKSIRKQHTGARHEIADGLYGMLSDETRRITDKALWMQVRDVVKASFDEARFTALTDTLIQASEQKITGDVEKVVEVTAKYFGASDGERGSILKHLISGGDLTRYGLFNAITRTAEDLNSYDRATEFERFGGQFVELGANDWNRMAAAQAIAA